MVDPDNLYISSDIDDSIFDSVLPLLEEEKDTIYNIASVFDFQSYKVVGIQKFRNLKDKIENKNKPCDFLLNLYC